MSGIPFETLREDLEDLAVPEGHARHMRWLAAPIAVAKTSSGDYEVFIRGQELNAALPLVRRHVQHGEWRPEAGGDPFSANRIILPSAPHFASIAALIVIELLRAGIAGRQGPQQAFTEVEPIIEMAIRRGALSENVIVGLIGELTVLRQLILARSGRPELMMRALDFWQGWQEGGRDFQFGPNSIEVKTTQAISSIHEFSGLHQLEPHILPSGSNEQLYLMSVGLAASTSIGETLPVIVDSILAMLSKSPSTHELADEFLYRVSLYGRPSGSGYLHDKMRDWSAYSTRYAHTFLPRLYRVNDPAMRLLGRNALSETFVQADSISFTMHIPDRVSSFNPVSSWEAELEVMASR